MTRPTPVTNFSRNPKTIVPPRSRMEFSWVMEEQGRNNSSKEKKNFVFPSTNYPTTKSPVTNDQAMKFPFAPMDYGHRHFI